MNIQNTTVVVSRYQENVSWLEKLTNKGIRVVVYDHLPAINNPYKVAGNFGNEAGSYMKYICDFYNNLSTYTIFIHAHEESWHHQGSLADNILHMLTTRYKPMPYESLNNLCMGSVKNAIYKDTAAFYDRYLAPYIKKSKTDLGDWTQGHVCCAQFIVHKSKILAHEKKMYDDIYHFIITTKKTPKTVGHLCEWTWHIVFQGKRNQSQCIRTI